MQKLWFKNKMYGWGWYPATWQGWAILGAYVVVFVLSELVFTQLLKNQYQTKIVVLFFIWMAIITGALIITAYKTGEKPKWQWGKKQ